MEELVYPGFATVQNEMLSFFLVKWTALCFQITNGPLPGSRKRPSEGNYEKEKDVCIQLFDQWSEADQVEFVEHLISRMCHYQHGHINSYLKPMLQRDFITALPGTHTQAFDACCMWILFSYDFDGVRLKLWRQKNKVIFGFGCLVCQGETDLSVLGLSWVWLSRLLLFIIVSCWPV